MNIKINRLIICKLARNFSLNTPENQKKNYYDSLGITPKATQGDVKTAYYNLSKLYHPDLNRGDFEASEKFKDITAAYEVLGNVKSRKMYDRGMLVGAFEETFESPETSKEETFKHAPFYHHRNKPTKKSKKVNPEYFDIDEWTKAHYSKTFQTEHYRKQAEQWNRKADQDQEQDNHQTGLVISVLVILSAFGLFQAASKNSNQDKPQSVQSTEE